MLSLVVVGAWLGGNIGWQALVTQEKYLFLRKIAIAFASIGGTSFNTADLTNAIFTQATLKSTDLRNANLTLTNFHLTKNLDRARVGNTILMNAKVRDLLVSKRGKNKSYAGCNLKGANLANADLSYVNLTEADVSEATFFQANLEGANLTKIQALKTNFQKARMTAAYLEAWNIDSTTQLAEVISDYVYLLNNQQERRPSSGKFAPGEFTKIFQKALHTVDLILRNGLNKAALEHWFWQLKIENEGTELSIRSVEDIGDGVVLVKVNVSATANKQKIHADFTQYYESAFKAIEERYQAQLQSQQRQTEEWREIAHVLASRPINFSLNLPEINAVTSRQSLSGTSVILNLGDGDFESGFPSITAQICEGGKIQTQRMGKLLPAPEIPKLYSGSTTSTGDATRLRK
ncbi:pentapeptide repeat-containing protein [Scytonema sp. PCC 10023]|uniref:pentapeptide repeat-containing protein n=1 Tax=Scytonema sp. PCC 10023 TaxID=1680591 RepID=UPI0039C7377B